MNRLAILDDNLEFSRNLLNYIMSENKKVRLSSLAINAKEIMESVYQLQEGDILLLDLGLPEINGLEVIDAFKKKSEHMPYIIVMSGNMELFEKLRDYTPYIYKAIEKPFAFRRMVDIIEQITYSTEQKYYEEIVKKELYQFDINVTTIGYTYLVDAIIFALQDQTLLRDMKNGLYKSVSMKNQNVNSTNVKWALEKCVKSTMRYTDSSIIKSYFHVEVGEKVTPKHFISMVVENVRRKLENQIHQGREKVYVHM